MTGTQFDASVGLALSDFARLGGAEPNEPHLTAREKAQIDKRPGPIRVEFQEAPDLRVPRLRQLDGVREGVRGKAACASLSGKRGDDRQDISRRSVPDDGFLAWRVRQQGRTSISNAVWWFGPHSTERAAAGRCCRPLPGKTPNRRSRLTLAEGRCLAASATPRSSTSGRPRERAGRGQERKDAVSNRRETAGPTGIGDAQHDVGARPLARATIQGAKSKHRRHRRPTNTRSSRFLQTNIGPW